MITCDHCRLPDKPAVHKHIDTKSSWGVGIAQSTDNDISEFMDLCTVCLHNLKLIIQEYGKGVNT